MLSLLISTHMHACKPPHTPVHVHPNDPGLGNTSPDPLAHLKKAAGVPYRSFLLCGMLAGTLVLVARVNSNLQRLVLLCLIILPHPLHHHNHRS